MAAMLTCCVDSQTWADDAVCLPNVSVYTDCIDGLYMLFANVDMCTQMPNRV